jgi:hypothetical protein
MEVAEHLWTGQHVAGTLHLKLPVSRQRNFMSMSMPVMEGEGTWGKCREIFESHFEVG